MEDKSQFAGFWKRVVAYMIDSLIISIGLGVLLIVAFFVFALGSKLEDKMMSAIVSIAMTGSAIVTEVMYHALFESSAKQATPGKMAMGIVATNAEGGRMGLGRAIGRNCARVLSSSFFGIGYIICGFTARRQALHDLIAGTLVVNNNAPLRTIGGSGLVNPGQISGTTL